MVSDECEIYQDDHLLSYITSNHSNQGRTPEINIMLYVNCK